jgi:hypothetical protein
MIRSPSPFYPFETTFLKNRFDRVENCKPHIYFLITSAAKAYNNTDVVKILLLNPPQPASSVGIKYFENYFEQGGKKVHFRVQRQLFLRNVSRKICAKTRTLIIKQAIFLAKKSCYCLKLMKKKEKCD